MLGLPLAYADTSGLARIGGRVSALGVNVEIVTTSVFGDRGRLVQFDTDNKQEWTGLNGPALKREFPIRDL